MQCVTVMTLAVTIVAMTGITLLLSGSTEVTQEVAHRCSHAVGGRSRFPKAW